MSLSEVTHTDLAEAIVSDKTASLILTGNLLTRLPSNMPEKVPNLSVLKVDKNSLSHFPMPIVRRDYETMKTLPRSCNSCHLMSMLLS